MFTGIVQSIGKVSSLEANNGTQRLRIETPTAEKLEQGSSVAVNGVCLTVDSSTKDGFVATLMPETIKRTTLGNLQKGSAVNIEPSLRMGDEIGGHFVFGHVDGVGNISKVEPKGSATILRIEIPKELSHLLAKKGSVAVDGVSLTVVDVQDSVVTVSLVEHTLKSTAFGTKKEGDYVNVEVDMLARYAQKQLH